MTTARQSRPRLSTAMAVVGACGIVWLVSELVSPPSPAALLPAARPATTIASSTPTTPPAQAKATVSRVVDARTVLTSAGERVVVAGLAPPGRCWSDTATDFTTVTLLGAEVSVVNPAPLLTAAIGDSPSSSTRAVTATLLLPDGTDFAAMALHQGHAKPTRDASATHHAAATAAGAGAQGLWGQPCLGEDVLPVPVPPPVALPTTAAKPAPATTKKPAGYYRNCTAARAAGVAPIPLGSPGYRPALDRDHNGLACEG